MKVLHQVITEQAYKQAEERSVLNHRDYKPSFLYYGKGRKNEAVYSKKGEIYKSKCSFDSVDVIPFDLDLLDDLRYFKNSYKTFINNIAKGQNHSVGVCEVDIDGNIIRELDRSEILKICYDN